MKAKLSLFIAVLLWIYYSQSFAAEVSSTWWATTVTNSEMNISTSSTWWTAITPADMDALWSEADAAWAETWLNAAWAGKPMVIAPKWSIWNYSEVACDKDYFTSNTCNQCFEWGKKMAWEKIAGLTDSWTNPNTTEQIIYNDEQKFPEIVNLWWAGTIWVNNPLDATKFWKYSDEIVWTDSATAWKQEFLLEWGKTVNYLEADLWASYALQKTDKKEWEPVWLLKFFVNYHDTDATAKESAIKTHTECVVYYAWTPVIAPVTPAPVTPKEATKVKTWPESVVLVLIAALLWLGFVKLRKKA